MSSFSTYMRRSPSLMIVDISYANAGSYAWHTGTVDASRRLWPSWCCSPSPSSVVLPAVAPSRKPRARASAADQIKSPTRWKPNIE